MWDQTVCSHILQQRLHLFVEWDGAFVCHSCEFDTIELRKQFIPAEDAVQFLWKKKKSFAAAMKLVFLISEWKKYSDGWWKFKCTEMRSSPSIYAPCWILLGRTFCRSVGIFCPYRGSIEVLDYNALLRGVLVKVFSLACNFLVKLCVHIVLQSTVFFVYPLQVSSWL